VYIFDSHMNTSECIVLLSNNAFLQNECLLVEFIRNELRYVFLSVNMNKIFVAI